MRLVLASTNYYRSWVRPVLPGRPTPWSDGFHAGSTFDEVRTVYEADEALRTTLVEPLARAELTLRAHTAHVIASAHGPRGRS